MTELLARTRTDETIYAPPYVDPQNQEEPDDDETEKGEDEKKKDFPPKDEKDRSKDSEKR
jgi:hypothetical protein